MSHPNAVTLLKSIAQTGDVPVLFDVRGLAVIALEFGNSGSLLVQVLPCDTDVLLLQAQVCRPAGDAYKRIARRVLELNAECLFVTWSLSSEGFVQADTFVVLNEVRNAQQAFLNALHRLSAEIATHREELLALTTKPAQTFTVQLTSMGTRKIELIKAVRELTGLGLKEAKDLVEASPQPVLEGLDRSDADTAAARLRAAGGSAEVVPAGGPVGNYDLGPFISPEANRQLREIMDDRE